MKMDPVLRSVLMEEYERKKKNKRIYQKKIDSYPKGSLVEKKRNNHYAYYLSFREGDKVITKYVRKNEVEPLKMKIEMRNEIMKECKKLNRQIKDLEKILKLKKESK